MGPRNRRNFLRRPLIVAFRDYYDVEKIIERAYICGDAFQGRQRLP